MEIASYEKEVLKQKTRADQLQIVVLMLTKQP